MNESGPRGRLAPRPFEISVRQAAGGPERGQRPDIGRFRAVGMLARADGTDESSTRRGTL